MLFPKAADEFEVLAEAARSLRVTHHCSQRS